MDVQRFEMLNQIRNIVQNAISDASHELDAPHSDECDSVLETVQSMRNKCLSVAEALEKLLKVETDAEAKGWFE